MPERTDFDPAGMSTREFYKLLNSVVVPRPIAWVSSTSADGVHNLAPHSFFTVSCTDPPIVQFTAVGRKDSLRNVEDTPEFVVNISTEEQFEQVNATGTNFPPDVGEFDAVGVEREPSLRVGPPRVAGAPVAIECALHSTLRLGNSIVVFGRVLHVAVHSAAVRDGHPEIEALRPLARLGGDQWSTIGKVQEISRIRYADWPGHYRP